MTDSSHDLMALQLPCDPDAPARTRDALSELDDLGWIAGDVMLVASELVTNAVLHSGCLPDHDIQVTARQGSDGITVSVRDPGVSGMDARTAPPADPHAGGWGLRVVEQLADSWGQERSDGYHVWATIPLPMIGGLEPEHAQWPLL
ncbi:MAG: ATP-binding protein [Solirubrobacteraceae bacterium]